MRRYGDYLSRDGDDIIGGDAARVEQPEVDDVAFDMTDAAQKDGRNENVPIVDAEHEEHQILLITRIPNEKNHNTLSFQSTTMDNTGSIPRHRRAQVRDGVAQQEHEEDLLKVILLNDGDIHGDCVQTERIKPIAEQDAASDNQSCFGRKDKRKRIETIQRTQQQPVVLRDANGADPARGGGIGVRQPVVLRSRKQGYLRRDPARLQLLYAKNGMAEHDRHRRRGEDAHLEQPGMDDYCRYCRRSAEPYEDGEQEGTPPPNPTTSTRGTIAWPSDSISDDYGEVFYAEQANGGEHVAAEILNDNLSKDEEEEVHDTHHGEVLE